MFILLVEYGLVHRSDCINCETCNFCFDPAFVWPRVQVCDTVIVPPRCEAFVKGSLLQASFGEKTDGLLEGLDTFKSET